MTIVKTLHYTYWGCLLLPSFSTRREDPEQISAPLFLPVKSRLGKARLPPSRAYQVCATVKRRRWRMLLFTSNFLKKQGEFRGELRGEILGDVGLFPGSLGSSSSRCICSLKVLM